MIRYLHPYDFFMRSGLLFILALHLQSCASYGTQATTMREGLLAGYPGQSLAIAEEKDSDENEVVASLDKGMLRRINNDFIGSNQIFEVAKREIEKLYGISITENLASVTINETLRGYEGDRYEQLLLHAYMAMNYLQLGQYDGARVEMLQASVKMQEWGDEPEEDAFLRYLEGIIYESLDEYDNALISYRKAYTKYKEKGGELYPEMPQSLKKDMLRLLSRFRMSGELERLKKEFSMSVPVDGDVDDVHGEMIVILNNGLAPIRKEASIYIFSPEVQQNLRVAFPVYKDRKQRLNRAVIRLDESEYGMESVEDIDTLARHSLEQAMPGIMARATARAVVKYNTQHTANNNGSLAGLIMTVTNLVTERADTRSWSTLPQEIQLKRIVLPAGEYPVQIEMKNAAGVTVDVIEDKVDIEPGKRSFYIRHWSAPIAKINKNKPAAGQ
jgi:hypothetical protein